MRRSILLFLLLALQPAGAAAQALIEQTGTPYSFDLRGRTIAVIMGDDVEINEAVTIPGYWKKWGARVVYVGTTLDLPAEETVVGERGFGSTPARMSADVLLADFDGESADVFYFPGGGSPESLLKNHRAKIVDLVVRAHAQGKTLAAFCGGPEILLEAKVAVGRRIAAEVPPEFVRKAGAIPVVEKSVEDGNLVTGSFPFAESFAVAVAVKLTGRRHAPVNAGALAARVDFAFGLTYRFEPREVADGELREVVQAAMLTSFDFPMNLYKPWEVVAVKDATLRGRVRAVLGAKLGDLYTAAGMPEAARAAYIDRRIDAPVYLFVVMRRRPIDARLGAVDAGAEVAIRQQTLAAGAFTSNLRVAAEKAGLGSNLCAGLPFLVAEADLAAAIDLPADRFVAALVAVGYPALKSLPQPVRPAGERLVIR